MTSESGYGSGTLDMYNSQGSSLRLIPDSIKMNGVGGYSISVSADKSNEASIVIRRSFNLSVYDLHLVMDSNNRIRFGASNWPTSTSQVGVGEVYLDGTTLKVRSS